MVAGTDGQFDRIQNSTGDKPLGMALRSYQLSVIGTGRHTTNVGGTIS